MSRWGEPRTAASRWWGQDEKAIYESYIWGQWWHLYRHTPPGVRAEMQAYYTKRKNRGELYPWMMTETRRHAWDMAAAKEWRAIFRSNDAAVTRRQAAQSARRYNRTYYRDRMVQVADDVDFARSYFGDDKRIWSDKRYYGMTEAEALAKAGD